MSVAEGECVEWDREETVRLLARCRDALAASDETAKAAAERVLHTHFLPEVIDKLNLMRVKDMLWTAGADPPTRLALNRALWAVLDGIAATLGDGYQSRYEDVEHALTSLAAIAEALGVKEDER